MEAETQQIQSPKTESIFQKTAGSKDLPGRPVFKMPPPFQCRGLGYYPESENYIPHAATQGSHAAAKDPACCS